MTKLLDITRDHCPMTFVKVKLELSKLASGDILEVVLTGKEPLTNVPRSAAEEGHEIISISDESERHRIKIRKK
ncbi:MAG: sulfurtransferase TusA family protein [Fibrobacteres bacterium]|nr:sulfurtransferase TusA family protein [Fibrobacterota bacterium]